MEEFGNYLKSHREKKGIRLEEIASITKIHLHNLELLESGKLEQLPPEPFIRGFITAYAKYVGLSPKETIEKYLQASGLAPEPSADTATGEIATSVTQTQTRSSIPRPASAATLGPPPGASTEMVNKFQLPSWPKLVTAAGVFFVAGISLLLIQVGKNADAPPEAAQNTPTQVEMVADNKPSEGTTADSRTVAGNSAQGNPAAPQATAPAQAPSLASAAPAAAAAPANAAAPAANPTAASSAPHLVEIEGAERTWVKVVIDSEAPTEFFLSPGKKVQYTAQQKIKVVLGNATGAKVVHNGEEANGKRFMGTIKSFRFPANAQFPQDVPKPAAPSAPAEGSPEEQNKQE